MEANEGMKDGLRAASSRGTPIYGECGGLMYLTDRIVLAPGWRGGKGESFAMCGVFPGETRMPARRVVSYVEGEASEASPLGAGRFRGHEFHYSDVVLDKDTRYAYRITRGLGIRDGLDGALVRRTLGTYTHLHPLASLPMFASFVQACRTRTIIRSFVSPSSGESALLIEECPPPWLHPFHVKQGTSRSRLEAQGTKAARSKRYSHVDLPGWEVRPEGGGEDLGL